MDKGNPFFQPLNYKLDVQNPIQLTPEQLFEISTADILILHERGDLEGIKVLDDAPYKCIEGGAAQEIAMLFRQLPTGMPARCHEPPFGLRFYAEGGLQRQCSICWECNNIYGDFRYDFDANHTISERLLALLKQLSK